jgi:glycosyltransferase involved in cell wall biosynthesis
MPSLPRRVVRRARGAAAVARRGPRRFLARALVEAGLFDRTWYERQAGRTWPDDRSAAIDYLGPGRRAGRSPHPLLEPEWLAPGRWRTGRRDPAELYLDGVAAHGSPHPLFDEGAHLAAHPEAADHPGRALGHWLSTHAPDDPLPGHGPGSRTTLARLRARLDGVVDLLDDQRGLASRRWSTHWDSAADRAYVGEWSTRPLPEAGPGQPLVSVVLPVHNRRAQVTASVRSVRQQTLADWELLVVDDGSTDGTADVVDQLAMLDPRIRVLRQPAEGAAAARNAGLAAARGRYVAFLDSDNVWLPQVLRVSLAAMAGDGLRAAHSVVEMRSSAGTRWLAYDGGRRDLEVVNHVDLNTFVAELDLVRSVGGFDPTLRRMIDWDLVLRLSAVVEPVLLPFVGVLYADERGTPDRISVREPATWAQVVLARDLVDWSALESGLADRVADRVSVVVTVRDGWAEALALVDGALAEPDRDVEVVVVDRGSRAATARMLTARADTDPRIRYLRRPDDVRTALGWDLGLALTTGEVVVLADAVVADRPAWHPAGRAWWTPLVDALSDAGVAAAGPLVVGPDLLLTRFAVSRPDAGRPPYAVLDRAAPEDAGHDGTFAVGGLGDDVVAGRAADLVRARGADPWYERAGWGADLTARIAGAGDDRRVVAVPEVVLVRTTPSPPMDTATVAALDERVGDRLRAGPAPDGAGLRLDLAADPPTLVRVDEPGLRWVLATAAPSSDHGDRWGDVPFAGALARALGDLGQHVVVERRETGTGAARVTSPYDDVLVNLRGLDPREGRPGLVTILWVISHPDLVGPDEVRAYDAAFAAGARWAATMTERAGVPVETLWQATDPTLFHPDLAEPDTGPAVLFVGSSRGVARPVVDDAVAAGLDLAVYGTRWSGRLDPRYLRGEYVPNDRLGAAYRSAGVVLADHWPDMAAQGFLSNRLFDAVAAGARVVSDPVDGIDPTVFGGAVRTYADRAELAWLAGPGRAEAFPDDAGLRAASAAVRRDHSFAARARTLLDTALRLREARDGIARTAP